MPSLQKQFLLRVRERWAIEFPYFRPFVTDEIQKLPKYSRYICDSYADKRGVYYFILFNMFQKKAGGFSLEISISDSNQKSIINSGCGKPSPINIGRYNINTFLGVQSYEWDMIDVEGEFDKFMLSIGGIILPASIDRYPDSWIPSSFDLPHETIIDQAIDDVNEKLHKFVLPKLEIDHVTK